MIVENTAYKWYANEKLAGIGDIDKNVSEIGPKDNDMPTR